MTSTNVKLQDLAEIRSGYPFRTAIAHDSNGRTAVVQMRDVDYATLRVGLDLYRVGGIEPDERYLLAPGEILFVAKGANNLAFLLPKFPLPTVAAPTFFVLRPVSALVMPAYLAWYINQRPAQEYLQSHWRGTHNPVVTKSAFETLDVPLPPLDAQRNIVEIHRLAQKERDLMGQLQGQRTSLINSLLLNAIA